MMSGAGSRCYDCDRSTRRVMLINIIIIIIKVFI